MALADFFRRLFARQPAPPTAAPSQPAGTHSVPVAPPTSGVTPVAPIDRPGVEPEDVPPAE